MAKLSIEDIKGDLKGKKVLMRVDFNVPLDENRNITSDKRIKAALPSIKMVMENGGKLILMSHMGRPKGQKKPEFSLDVVAKKLGEFLEKEVKFAPDCVGPEAEKVTGLLADGEAALLENLRFYKEETDNDPEFAKKLAAHGEIYVNDAFGTAHRAHASVEGVTKYFDKCAAGLLMDKELKYIGETMENAEKPFVAILGGAKVSDKIGVIQNMLDKVSEIIIGGGMAYTFLKAKGRDIGNSICEDDKIPMAKEILKAAIDKDVYIFLPIDHVVAKEFKADSESKEVLRDGIEDGWQGLDIGPMTVKKFRNVIKDAKTIIWNGPMGVFEFDKFANGTLEIGRAIAESGAKSIVGGGDSVAALKKMGLTDKMTHVSTGGGASLALMEGKELPGVAALSDK